MRAAAAWLRQRGWLQVQHPSMLAGFQEFTRRAKGRRTAVFLDYDGAPPTAATQVPAGPSKAARLHSLRDSSWQADPSSWN